MYVQPASLSWLLMCDHGIVDHVIMRSSESTLPGFRPLLRSVKVGIPDYRSKCVPHAFVR